MSNYFENNILIEGVALAMLIQVFFEMQDSICNCKLINDEWSLELSSTLKDFEPFEGVGYAGVAGLDYMRYISASNISIYQLLNKMYSKTINLKEEFCYYTILLHAYRFLGPCNITIEIYTYPIHDMDIFWEDTRSEQTINLHATCVFRLLTELCKTYPELLKEKEYEIFRFIE